MKAAEARKHYPLYTRYYTRRHLDYLLVMMYCDPDTQEATTMLVIDINKQEQVRIDFDMWDRGIKAGEVWRVEPK